MRILRMSKKKNKFNKEVSNIHRMNSPKTNKKFFEKSVITLNNSFLETLACEKEKNLQFISKTSENTSLALEDNLFLDKNSPISNTKTDEKIIGDANAQLLNQTIDLCQDENTFTNFISNIQTLEIPNTTENIDEIVDLSTDITEKSEVILLKDKSKVCLKSNKTYDTPVIDLSEDGDGENESKINDDIIVVKVFKNSTPPLQFTQSVGHPLDQNSIIKSLHNISNSNFLKWCKEKNDVQFQTKQNKSKKNKKRKLKSMLVNHNKLNNKKNRRRLRLNGLHQKNLVPSSDSSVIGKNIYLNSPVSLPSSGLRPIIIDGSNVAIGNVGKKCRDFSCKKLEICINFFKKRGHKVTAFVPQFRTKFNRSDNPALLNKLVEDGDVILTPSKIIEGKCIVPYDDRFIVQTAVLKGGIIVSRDNYRDLLAENSAWAETINYRTLPFTWIDDVLMFPNDPLGEHGPSLDEFLKFH